MPGVIPGNLDRTKLVRRAIARAHEHEKFRGSNVQKNNAANKATIITVDAGISWIVCRRTNPLWHNSRGAM